MTKKQTPIEKLADEGDYDSVSYEAGFTKARDMAAEKIRYSSEMSRLQLWVMVSELGEEETE